MKVIKTIKNIIFGLLMLIFFVFATAMAVTLINRNKYGVTVFGDSSLVSINKKLSNKDYKRGDLVIVENKKLSDYKPGEEVFVYVIRNEKPSIDIGVLGAVDLTESRIEMENGSLFKDEYLLGTATKVYPGIGTPYSIIGSTMGFLFIVLIPCFLIFIYQLYALIVEIKYGKEKVTKENTNK